MGKRKKNKIVNTLKENDLKAADILIKYAKEKEVSSKKKAKDDTSHDVNYASNLPKIASKAADKATDKGKDKIPHKKELSNLSNNKSKNNSSIKKENDKSGKSLLEIEKELNLEKTLKLNKKILENAIEKSKPTPKKDGKKDAKEVKKENKEGVKTLNKAVSKDSNKEVNKEPSKSLAKNTSNSVSKNNTLVKKDDGASKSNVVTKKNDVTNKSAVEPKKDEVAKRGGIPKDAPKKTLEQATGAKEVIGTKKSVSDINSLKKNVDNTRISQPKKSDISQEDMLEAAKILEELDAEFENKVLKKKEELKNKNKEVPKVPKKDESSNKVEKSKEAAKNLQDTVDILKELNQAIDKREKAKKEEGKKVTIETSPQIKKKETEDKDTAKVEKVEKEIKIDGKLDEKKEEKGPKKEEPKEKKVDARIGEPKPKREKKKINILLNMVSVSCLIFLALCFGLLFYRILNINMIPVKYLATGVGLFVVAMLILILMIISKLKSLHIVQIVLSLLLGVVFASGSTFVKNYDDVFKDLFTVEDTTSTYYVVTLVNDEITTLDELSGLKVGLLNQSLSKIQNNLSAQNLEYKVHESIGQLTSALREDDEEERVRALIICSSVYDYLAEEDKEFFGTIKKIYEFDIHITSEELEEEEKKEEILNKPPSNILENVNTGNSFIVYISGIDGGGEIRAYGLSDVNILAVVNPSTHKILLVSTPRDYYVQVAGTTGLKDKLTHAGLYGINTSIKTMNNIYGIKIDYYAKVTFGALERIVDDIDGIDVYSDTAFNSFHMNGWYVNKGMNHMDGKKALAYSRERYAYAGGDRHRIKNQQDVMGAIVKKVATNKSYLLKFNDILSHIQPYFTTNIPYEKMQELVKEQLDSLRPWNVINVSVNGTNASNYTASWPKQLTYVMIPTQSTIEEAQRKIVEIMRVD